MLAISWNICSCKVRFENIISGYINCGEYITVYSTVRVESLSSSRNLSIRLRLERNSISLNVLMLMNTFVVVVVAL